MNAIGATMEDSGSSKREVTGAGDLQAKTSGFALEFLIIATGR